MGSLPSVAISMGDPAGVGPELCLRVFHDARVRALCNPVIIGDIEIVRRVAPVSGLPAPEPVVSLQAWQQAAVAPAPAFVNCGQLQGREIEPGSIQKRAGEVVRVYIEAAVKAAMDRRVAAIVTAPIHKAALKLAGLPYPGHTEMIADMTGARRYCMMLASEPITVSLATIHVGYADVPAHLTPDGLLDVIRLTVEAMRRLGRPNPRLTVCSLNPHGGEQGLFGSEEADIIEPAIAQARAEGFRITGPLPPDTAFVAVRRAQTDAYIAMYHDQGLIPFKMLAFETGVNITLGLPIVRTSPDHGTAFDIAWQGKASATSMIEAVKWAVRLAKPGQESVS